MPGDSLDLHAVGLFALFTSPEFLNELIVLGVIEVHLSVVVVLKHWMLMHLLWNILTSEAPNTLDFEIWNVTNDTNSG